MSTLTHKNVSDYYGKVLQTKKDLKTSACCTLDSLPDYVKKPLKLIDDEIQSKFYGCGSPIPLVLEGMKILDLGCGTGRDCYILSYLAGEAGEVYGVDMTEEQLEVARRHLPSQMNKFGFSRANVKFLKGYIEDLKSIQVPDNYFDLVISNCVVNLSPDKNSVLSEVYRVLKPGGEFFFSDVYVDRRLPQWAKEDPILVGECLGGALYWKDFERLCHQIGFLDPRVSACSTIELLDKETIEKVGFANFHSITYRLFKLPRLETTCEDYGQTAEYQGTIKHSLDQFELDNHHNFQTGQPLAVCGNTVSMLTDTRLKDHFIIAGDRTTHYGIFKGCGEMPKAATNQNSSGCC